MTQPLEAVSVTELFSFRECRRAWYLGNVRRLEPIITPMPYWFGTGIHAALQAYHTREGELAKGATGKTAVETALDAYEEWYTSAEDEVAKSYGFLWEGARQEYWNVHELSVQMLRNYDEFHRSTEEQWDPIAVEQRVWVPIIKPDSRRALWKRPRLTARLDYLGRRRALKARPTTFEKRGAIIVDHKTAGQSPVTGRDLDLDDQLSGYAYIYWRLTGELPEFIIYNTLIKRAPKPPEILQSGAPSKALGQSTTFGMYLDVLREKGLNPSDYAKTLEALQAEGWSRYFVREGVTRNLEQIRSYEEHLYFTFRDMQDVANHPEKAYPSPSVMRCGNCVFKSVCQAMEDGSDAEYLINAQFKVSTEERW